ncbi:MAG: hypothetical protein ACOY4M_08385 [Pseudomonadota bacterium]
MRIEIIVKGIDDWIARLRLRGKDGWMGVFITSVSQYLLGGLREYAQWRAVTRKSVYGTTFFSARQQRAFFAKLNSGDINVPYIRTGVQGRAWRFEGMRTPNSGVVANRTSSVIWTRGQTRLHARMGWRTALEQARRDINVAIQKAKNILIAYLSR